jgi:tRNA(fMet)-specific endonuclease VapC
MLILDTDHLTVVQKRTGIEYERLNARLEASAETEQICATTVSLEEQTRGWLEYIKKAKTEEQRIHAYRRLHSLHDDYRVRTILDYDDRASSRYQHLVQSRVRVGTMDLRIAAIALANGATLPSRNARDFGKVSGLRVEDWTRE